MVVGGGGGAAAGAAYATSPFSATRRRKATRFKPAAATPPAATMLLRGRLTPALAAPAPAARRRPARRPARAEAKPARPDDASREDAISRRAAETRRVAERVGYLRSAAEWEAALAGAGDRLVVLEVRSEVICQTGLEEEPELQWRDDRRAALEPCLELKHTFQRTARECPDVEFRAVDADSPGGKELAAELGVRVLPTVQFWRRGRMLWKHEGVSDLDRDLGEGVLFYGDTAAAGEKASQYVEDLADRAAFAAFLAAQPAEALAVVDCSLTSASPCVHIFPAVLALARAFRGQAAFARLLGDAGPEAAALFREHGVVQVPTFLFFRGGELIGRHVGSSRGDLIGSILAVQGTTGELPAGRAPAAAPAAPRQEPVAGLMGGGRRVAAPDKIIPGRRV